MYTIDPQKQTEVLRWLMFAWDGQWQARILALYGPTEASRLGARVRSAFGKVEMRALLSLVGKERAVNLADAANLLETYFNFVWGERSFQGRFLPPETGPNGMPRLTVQVREMTALESLKKAAQAAGEDPSLACEMLWSAWLETLLPDTQVQVTARLGDTYDQFQIDNLGEALPNPVPFPGRAAAPAAENANNDTDLPDEAAFEESPIAAALQIPLERVAPGLTGELNPPSMDDPYASGPASYSPPPGTTGATPGPDSLRYAPAPTTNNLFSTQQLIGASEPGADQNLLRRGGTGGLTSRLQQKAETPASHAPPTEAAQAQVRSVTPPPQAAPLPAMPDFQPAPYVPYQNDPATGRPLFSTDPEEEARSKVLRSKNLPLMSRLFMGKEARELIDRGKGEPMVHLTSVAEKVDFILQRRMAQARMTNPGQFLESVRVVGGPEGSLEILIGNRRFSSIEQVPPGPTLDIIRQAVEEYSQDS
jgi:hypothetical protein